MRDNAGRFRGFWVKRGPGYRISVGLGSDGAVCLGGGGNWKGEGKMEGLEGEGGWVVFGGHLR